MTESMPIASARCPRRGARGAGELASVGFAAGPRVAVVGVDDEACVAPGAVGEVCVAGDCVTAGYELRGWQAADPNAAAFVGGAAGHRRWLRTGDLGLVEHDAAGDTRLRLVGRSKEIVNRGGEKISPLAVEDVLLRHPAVREVACFAAPHAQLGEVVGAVVVLEPGRFAGPDDLAAWCAGGGGGATLALDGKWAPATIIYAARLPTGPTGKPLRLRLAAKIGLPPLDAAAPGVACYDVGAAAFADGAEGAVLRAAAAAPAAAAAGDRAARDGVDSMGALAERRETAVAARTTTARSVLANARSTVSKTKYS